MKQRWMSTKASSRSVLIYWCLYYTTIPKKNNDEKDKREETGIRIVKSFVVYRS
jgi:hypothetical protein